MLAKEGWKVEIDTHGHYDTIKSSRASSKMAEAIVQGKEERFSCRKCSLSLHNRFFSSLHTVVVLDKDR